MEFCQTRSISIPEEKLGNLESAGTTSDSRKVYSNGDDEVTWLDVIANSVKFNGAY